MLYVRVFFFCCCCLLSRLIDFFYTSTRSQLPLEQIDDCGCCRCLGGKAKHDDDEHDVDGLRRLSLSSLERFDRSK